MASHCARVVNYPASPHLKISEAGNFPPASCIFTFAGGLSSFCMAIAVFIRYHDLRGVSHITGVASKVNLVSFVAGELMSFFFYVVVCFQSANVPIVHYIAAIGLFSAAIIFLWANVWLGYQLENQRDALSRTVLALRTSLAIVQNLGFVCCPSFTLPLYTHQ